MNKIKTAWIIIDDIPGNANQAIAVAKAMNVNYQVKTIKYNFFSFLPNWLKFNTLLGIDWSLSSNLDQPYPDLIISSGRKTALVSAYIKKRDPKIFNVHLMNPDMCFSSFDMICLPYHDKSSSYDKYNNIHYSIGAPCYLDQNKLKESAEIFQKQIGNFKRPFVCLMIGGKTKFGNYSLDELKNLVLKAQDLVTKNDGSLLISTSRRTDPSFNKKLIEDLKVPYFFFDWHKDNIENNPYLAYLSLSDYFIITGDSVSTCSEALTTGKPTYIYYKNEILSKKHRIFLANLLQLGYIRYLDKGTLTLETWNYNALEEAEKICSIINEKL